MYYQLNIQAQHIFDSYWHLASGLNKVELTIKMDALFFSYLSNSVRSSRVKIQ